MSLRPAVGTELWVDQGGKDTGPTLLLMHGLSGTGRIWDGLRPLLEKHWPGRWIIPDMRGHGRSSHSDRYGIACHASDMADLVSGVEELYLAGHSMGGLVGILMASGWFGVMPKAVVTSGVKVDWTEEERAGLFKLIDMPVKWFDSEDDAKNAFAHDPRGTFRHRKEWAALFGLLGFEVVAHGPCNSNGLAAFRHTMEFWVLAV